MNQKSTFFQLKRSILGSAYRLGKLAGVDRFTLSVLCYHSISSAKDRYSLDLSSFAEQMRRIAAHAHFVSLNQALKVLDGGYVPRPAVTVTFDDGYVDVTNIVPFVRSWRIPISLFVLSDPARVDRRELDHNGALLTDNDLLALIKEGWTIGCHSATHADFRMLTDRQILNEIVEAKKSLEDRLGVAIEYFAYPKGVFDQRIISAVQQAGYKAAFSVAAGCITPNSDRWKLPRTIIDKTHHITEFPALYSPTSFAIRRATDWLRLWDRLLIYET